MLNQEQLAAIAAAMSILQQQQQQQQALINQYQAELQQIQNHQHPDGQQPNSLHHSISPKLHNQPPITTAIPSTQEHLTTATSAPHQTQLSRLQQQLTSPQIASKLAEQQQLQSSITQTTPSLNNSAGLPMPTKQTRPPISYSAIVAKSTGSSSTASNNTNAVNAVTERNNLNCANGIAKGGTSLIASSSSSSKNHLQSLSTNTNDNDIMNHLTSSNINQVPPGFATIANNPINSFGIVETGHHQHQLGLSHNNSLTSHYGVTASALSSNNDSSAVDSDFITRFSNLNNGTNNSHTNSTYRATLNPLSVSSSLVSNSNNHLNTSASKSLVNSRGDIFASNNNYTHQTNHITGSSLGHTNGSSLLKQPNTNLTPANNNLHQQHNLALEPTLSYTTEHSNTSPAHQLFSSSTTTTTNNSNQHQLQRSSFIGRHHDMPTSIFDNQQQQQNHGSGSNNSNNINLSIQHPSSTSNKNVPAHGRATNLLGFMGLYVGNLSPDLTKEQLEKIFSKYGEPVKAHRLIRSPVAFIKYENIESPRAAIDDLYGVLLPELTLNQDQALKLHFDRNDAQLKANYRPTELPKEDNGECYGWRTTVCRRGKSCPKKHIPINRGIDFQMWMIKSTTTTSSTLTTTNTFATTE